jgi:maltooligosyltrehalose trehalohydrolase
MSRSNAQRPPARRRLPIGAEPTPENGTHFRVWAAKHRQVDVEIGDSLSALTAEGNGYHSGLVEGVRAGDRYRFRLGGKNAFPDPASRYQPEGPHGPSQIVDPTTFAWTDDDWRGVKPDRQIMYEMHIGTFTPEGTYSAAAEQIAELASLGVTVLEVMPIAEFPGRFGWGYDGVDLFAPYHQYGTPDDFRAFVNRAHDEGLGVILDVVYNHFGPDGNYLGEYSDTYVSEKHVTDWGDALNFDGRDSAPVREFVLSNVRHWIAEYHLDGLRLDATQNIYDSSASHILRDIGVAAREAAGERHVIVVAESEHQEARIVRSLVCDGYGLDMIWCDDFHHSASVAATGRREAYFTDYRGSPQELISLVRHGVLYQGQRYTWQNKRRGSAAWDVPKSACVFCLENHDQVANSRGGERLHQLTSPGRYRALTAVLLLAPETPLLFQGQEFGTSAPFLFFADHNPELAKLVRTGRATFLSQFISIRDPETRRTLPDPEDRGTFERCVLSATERKRNGHHLALHRDLIALRQCDPVLCSGVRIEGAVLDTHAFVLRFFGKDDDDRLLVVNLGADLALDVVPEPLLAPANLERGWTRTWHSEDPSYGGRGAAPLESENGSWRIPAESATLLVSDDA